MIQIEESNPSFESCNKCIYSDDSEETCILRRCIHAVAQLQECYVPKQPTIEPEPQIIHCNRCKHYQGVHNVQGHAPCNYWGTGAVLWNEYCSKAEPYRKGEK